MSIKIVALDLDGTTLNNEGKLMSQTREAFEAAQKKGTHIVVATGRTFASLPEEIIELKGLEYIITSNGAHITRLCDREIIYSNYLEGSAVDEVINLLYGTDHSLEVFTEGRAYIGRKEFEEVKNAGSTYRDVNYILSTRTPVDDIFHFMKQHKNELENINVNFEFLEDRAEMEPKLRAIDGVTVTSSFSHNWELGGRETSKGNALEILCKKLGITPKEELMACGDSPNDISMLKLAKIGVAVANAETQVINEAQYVTASNEDDGVGKAIRKFVI